MKGNLRQGLLLDLFGLCKEMYKIGEFPQQDILLLRKAIEYTDLTKKNMNFMLRVSILCRKYDMAVNFLNNCIGGNLTEDSDLIALARESRTTILHGQKQQKAIEMLENGCEVDVVYKEVGLTESEVIELKKKYVDSDDAPPIFFGGFDIDI